jgi:ABC-2 type transport system ATP-binding protein
VLGNQITPVDVILDGRQHTVSVSLEIVVAALRAGSRLTLQLTPTTVAYARPRLGGDIKFSSIRVSLPVSADVAPA